MPKAKAGCLFLSRLVLDASKMLEPLSSGLAVRVAVFFRILAAVVSSPKALKKKP
jgi:hypothetical protein